MHHVALTLEQVIDLDLPSSPLKDTELRSDRWRAAHGGRQQTEVDALCALRPEILDRIVEDALAPFRDATLRRRAQEARSRAEMEMNRQLRAHSDYQTVCESILEAHGAVTAAIDRLRQCQGEGAEALSALGRTEIEPIEAEIEVDPPEPLFDSEDDYTIATRRLINHKKLNGSEP